jgi:hypothetical protein
MEILGYRPYLGSSGVDSGRKCRIISHLITQSVCVVEFDDKIPSVYC